MPARRREPVSMPRVIPSSYVRHDYGIDDSISRMGYISNAVLEDTFDAAAKSRGKDHELLRNANSAIRPSPSLGISSSSSGRRSQRFRSLPPSRDRSTSPTMSSLMSTSSSLSPLSKSRAPMPYSNANAEKLRLALTPHPTSLLSNRISAFLRGSSVPPTGSSGISYKSYLDSATPPSPSFRDNASSIVSYKSFLSDPSVTRPFTNRSSSRLYKGYEPPSYSPVALQTYRSASVPRYNTSYVDENEEDDDEDYEAGGYRREYGRRPRVLYYKTSSPEGSDVEEEDYDSGTSGTYSLPRPSGASPLHLSSYDAPHDGSYEADMAEMYDYVPFGPSRQGILELTQHEDYPNDDNSDIQPSISPPLYTQPTTSYPLIRSIPSVSLIPHISQPSSGELTTPSSSFAQTPVFEQILASTAARARTALRDSSLPYKDASLVLSLEGSALSEDGKSRYGFRYYPPPIPLKGSGVGLDERLLGIVPQAVSPADSFLGGYLSRLRSLRSDMDNQANDAEERARGRSVVPRPLPPLPSYSHQTIHMPVHIAGRAKSVPVSSYRSRPDDGVAHRVDVYPLLETQARLPKGTGRLPLFKAASGDDSPTKLSILDKINIKAAIIGSKMEAEDGAKKRKKGPRSTYAAAKYRELRKEPSEEAIYYNTISRGNLQASKPPLPKPTDRRAIRDVDGYTKPKNVMSWQYRVESRLNPDDIIDQPATFSRMRDRVREAQEKMDRHRQLLDRYLDKDTVSSTSRRKDYGDASGGSRSAGGDPNQRPVSDLRRRLRRTIAKGKNNPDYYRE